MQEMSQQFSQDPEVSTDISGQARDEAKQLLNDALDRINDLAAEDKTIKIAHDYFMKATFGSSTFQEDFTEEQKTEWFRYSAEFYTNLFLNAARIQSPVESTIARGIDLRAH